MALLQDIITEAAGESTSTASLLRMARVVATRLRITDALDWIGHELNGYSQDVPDYRGPLPCEVKGNFVGPFGSSLSEALIAIPLLSAEFQEARLDQIFVRQSIAAIEDLVAADHEGTLRAPWPGAAVARFNYHHDRGDFTLYQGMGALSIWNAVSASAMKAILDAVRTRVLDFALNLEIEDPDAGERAGASLVTPEQGNAIFHTTINGPGANVAQGSSNFTQNAFINAPKTDAELIQRLREIGVREELLAELEQALNDDRATDQQLTAPGPHVQSWLGRILTLGRASTAAIGTGVATGVVTDTVLNYFG